MPRVFALGLLSLLCFSTWISSARAAPVRVQVSTAQELEDAFRKFGQTGQDTEVELLNHISLSEANTSTWPSRGFASGTLTLFPGKGLLNGGGGRAVLDTAMKPKFAAINGAYLIFRNITLMNLCFEETVYNPRRGWSWVMAVQFSFISRVK